MADVKQVRVAILDLYEGHVNQGMRCIREILNLFADHYHLQLTWDEFDVRRKNEVPDLSYDVFISSGGPGSPLESEGMEWENTFFNWISQVKMWNENPLQEQKKHVFFICHSFQMACHHFGLATLNKRKSTSFGVMTIHKTEAGTYDPILEGLQSPFYAIDSRDFQVVQPKLSIFKKKGAQIIALEKIRNHVEYERAIMGVRFSDEFVGLQFHPEADALSFIANLKSKERRENIIAMKGKTKFRDMLEDLLDEDKIYKTNETIIPNFLRIAINDLMKHKKILSN